MKSVFFSQTGSTDNIQVGDLDIKEEDLKRGQVRLKFLSGSLNHLDLWVLKGLPRLQYQFPHIAGADICGEIIESQSDRFKVGERCVVYPAVCDDSVEIPENLHPSFKIRGENFPGVFRESLIVEDRYLYSVPKHLKNSEAASLPLVYLTAWQMLTCKAGLFPGRFNSEEPSILVHGAGSGVSQALLELLLSMGCKKIALSSREESKLKAWSGRGVHTFVSKDSLGDDLKNWLGKNRFSVIFDHVGGVYFEMNIRLLQNGGKLVTCGSTSDPYAKLDLRHLYFRQLQLLGSTMGSLKHFHEVMGWIAHKSIKPAEVVSFAFKDAQKAYRLMDESKQNGKIVIEA